jgi:hypothetical protein
MKTSYLYLLAALLFYFQLSNCSLFPKKSEEVNNDLAKAETVYKNCMETFADEVKCKELSEKTKHARNKEEAESSSRQVVLTEEQEKNIWNRSDLKNKFMTKSKLAVLEQFGEPDDRYNDSMKEHLIYRRPISRYSIKHDPDKEIRFIIVRNQVSLIQHTSPDSTPTGFEIVKKIPK